MNTNGRVRDSEPNVAASFSELAHDAIELAELQVQLFSMDIQAATRRSRASFLLGVVGVCLLLGAVPVILLAIGEVFAERWGWSRAGGYALAAGLGIVASIGLSAAAWYSFRSGIDTMKRSRDELNRNLAWLKSSLRSRPMTHSGEKEYDERSRPAGPMHPR